MSTNTHSMTVSHGRAESVSHGESESHSTFALQAEFDLPSDVRTLAAMRTAIDTKIAQLRTAGAETLRSLVLQESAALDMSPEEILGGAAGKKKSGRKGRAKREE